MSTLSIFGISSYRNFKALKFRQTLYPSGKRWTALGCRADTIQRLSAAFVLPEGSECPKGQLVQFFLDVHVTDW
ncbi:MAG: hypothetical protein AB1352_03840 [Patescibacteria group bacterium]